MAGLFDNMLKGDESLFVNLECLDYSYNPKLIKFRDSQQFYIAGCIKPLFSKRDGRNLLIHGSQGIGKTMCCRHVLNELEEKSDEILVVYINCWIDETAYKIAESICKQIGHALTVDRNTKELIDEFTAILNKKSAVIVFDEFDKLQDCSILYNLLEKVYRKCIIMVTNNPSSIQKLEPRIMSRLNLDKIEFKPYNFEETRGILSTRKEHAFAKNAFDEDAFNAIAKKTFELKDIRKGLFLLKEAGNLAEDESSRKIMLKHAEIAIKKTSDFKLKDLDEEEAKVLELINTNPEKQLKDTYELYKKETSKSYKTFQRIVTRLKDARYLK